MCFMFVSSFCQCICSCVTQLFAVSLFCKMLEVKTQMNLSGTNCSAFFKAVNLDNTELQLTEVLANQVKPKDLTG